MEIRNSCRALWKECFHDSDSYMDYYFKEKCQDNCMLIQSEKGQVVSMAHLNPYRLKWKGREIDSYYMVGVATKKAFRGQGRMRSLLEQGFMKMRQEDVPFAFLMPIDKRIYEPFGFKTIYTQQRIQVKGLEEADLKAASLQNKVAVKPFSHLIETEKKKAVDYSRQKLAREFDIYAIRDEHYYSRLQKEMESLGGNVAVFFDMEGEEGRIVGIVPYWTEDFYVEAVEALIEPCFTKEITELLLQQEKVRERDRILFYESRFLDKNRLEELGGEMEIILKEIIMAKVLEDEKTFDEVFGGQKVYLNEIV